MELTEAILGRRSVRTFTDKAVEKEKIIKIINLAIYAPSASNRQAWKFILIDDEKIKQAICSRNGGGIQYGKDLILNAPSGILVLYRNDVSKNSLIYKDHIQSASAAIQNMLLAAYEQGIATCWICKLPKPKILRKMLSIPKNYDIIAYVAMGYEKEYLCEHTAKHYNFNTKDTLKRTRKYNVDDVLSVNRLENTECIDAFKYPRILFLLQDIQLHFRSNKKTNKIINKILHTLILYFAKKKKSYK